MRKSITILTILILYNGFVFGQETTFEKAHQIKISPLRIIDPVNPGFEISFEKLYGKSLSSQISIAYMKDPFNLTQFTNYRGVRLSFEEKFFKNAKTHERTYFSVEPVYLRVNYTDMGMFIKDTALGTPQYWDTFKVAKQTFSLNLKYGVQYYLKRLIIDGSLGLGIKYKYVRRNELVDKNAYQVLPRHPNAYFEASKAGGFIALNVPVNIKIGYSF